MNHKLVKDFMTSPAITIEESQTIKDAINLFKEKNIGFLPITKSNIIVGVVTDRDVLIRGIGIFKLNSKINKIMTSGEIHFVSPDTQLTEAAKLMSTKKIRRLVVLDDGKVIGVLTSKNLISEPSLIPYITETYKTNKTLNEYSIYNNSNPHDSVKATDYPL